MPTNKTAGKQAGFSIVSFIVLLAMVPIIAWVLHFIISRDFSESKKPTIFSNQISSKTEIEIATTSAVTTPTLATTTTTLATKIATTSPATAATSSVKNIVAENKNAVTVKLPAIMSENTITLTDKGFSPTKIQVHQGDSVTFINDSTGKMWVAANPFPSSSEYPAFNEKSGVENGESWTFTFDKVGTWFYHNHYNQTVGAKIVVSP